MSHWVTQSEFICVALYVFLLTHTHNHTQAHTHTCTHVMCV